MLGKVASKSCTCRFLAIEGPGDFQKAPFQFLAKFRAGGCHQFLSGWGRQVGSFDITGLYVQPIQGGNHQTYSNRVTRDHRGVGEMRGNFSLMPSSNVSCLSPIVLPQFNVKYKMTIDVLVTNRYFAILYLFHSRGSQNSTHFIHNCIPPKCVTIFGVQLLGVLCTLRHFYSILVGSLPVLGLDLGEDGSPLTNHVWNPPRKGRLLLQLALNYILCHLNRVRFLAIFQRYPRFTAVLPLN